MRKSIEGKKAVVIGAGGIGRGIAKAILENGGKVILVDISQENINLIKDNYPDVIGIQLDIDTKENIVTLFEKVREIYDGQLDFLVNAAGIGKMAHAIDITEADWNAVVNHFLNNVFWACQEAAKIMLPQKSGKIINIASMSGIVVTGDSGSSYAAAKAAVIQLTKALATEWIKDGVFVNAISPGMVRTALTAGMFDHNEEAVRQTNAQIPLGRIAQPIDIAGPALFLLSEYSNYIVGHNLVADGGYTLW